MEYSAQALWALHRAAEDGDLKAAEALIHTDDYLVFGKEAYQITPLHRAAGAGHAAMASLLAAHGADVNAKDKGGAAPLHYAGAAGHLDTAEVLLKARANPSAKDNEKVTPLHLAARNDHGAVVDLLLAKGADVNAAGAPNGTPLHEAAAGGHMAAAQSLLAEGGNANAQTNQGRGTITPWRVARDNGHQDLADLLSDYGGQEPGAGPVSIHRAAEAGYLGRAQALLAKEPDMARHKDYLHRRTPLHWAAQNGHTALAALLLAHNADVNAKDKAGDTPLRRAMIAGQMAMAALLVEYGGRE